MTSVTWMLVTSLLLSLMVSLAVGCNKISNGNWMKKLSAAEAANGRFKRPDRTQTNSRIARQTMLRRNRRNAAVEDDYSYSSSSSMSESVMGNDPVGDDPNAIRPELLPPAIDLSPAEIFDKVDINADGIVTKREYSKIFPNIDVEMVFLSHDHNGDGVVSRHEFLGGREYGNPLSISVSGCEQRLMEICDYQFINATRQSRDNPSANSVCNNFQVYVDCLARENKICTAEEFVQKILSIASGLRDDGECPDLQLTALRFPHLDIPRPRLPFDFTPEVVDQLPIFPDNHYDQPPLPQQAVDVIAEQHLLPAYGSGFKQQDEVEEETGYGRLFDNFDEMMLADEDTGSSVSSSYGDEEFLKTSKSAAHRDSFEKDGDVATRTRTDGPHISTNKVELYENGQYNDVTTSSYDQEQLQAYQKEHFRLDTAVESATSSYSTERAISPRLSHHRRQMKHHGTRTESSEQLQRLNIRQVRSSTTTKRRPVEKSRNKSRANCAVSTISPCNQAFISALAQGQEDPCESLVRFRHCVHKSTRHCNDFNVFKIREGLKYLSKEHRRAKLCRQITL